MEQKQSNNVRFHLFCIEVAQAGIALTMQELKTIYNASFKLEGWTNEDFEKTADAQKYADAAQRAINAVNKYKQLSEMIAFNIITRKPVEELDKKDDLIEYVGKVKRLAGIMAEEFLEPDEKLEKVVTDGRRVIEHFIDQWKKSSFEPSAEEIKD